jgi:hypothetical protein
MHIHNKLALSLVLTAALGHPSVADAASYSCSVTITEVLVYGSGVVNVKHSGRNDYTFICNLTTPRSNVSVQVCAMWTSALLSLKADAKQARFLYDGPVGSTCATLPTYDSAPAPLYIGAI